MTTDDSIARLRISLFGGFRIEGQQHGQIRLTGKRGTAIIAYLARCPGMAAPREKLADLLWSDSDSGHSRNSLRQTLSLLRRDLMQAGVDIIQSRKYTLGLKADAVESTSRILKGACRPLAAGSEAALAVYGGPFRRFI